MSRYNKKVNFFNDQKTLKKYVQYLSSINNTVADVAFKVSTHRNDQTHQSTTTSPVVCGGTQIIVVYCH